MQRIEEQGPWRKRLALRILTWLAFAEERLSPIELQHAVAIKLPEDSPGGDLEPRENGLDEDSIPEMSVIDSICAGLITYDTEHNVISLAHDTTNEYVRKEVLNGSPMVPWRILPRRASPTFPSMLSAMAPVRRGMSSRSGSFPIRFSNTQ